MNCIICRATLLSFLDPIVTRYWFTKAAPTYTNVFQPPIHQRISAPLHMHLRTSDPPHTLTYLSTPPPPTCFSPPPTYTNVSQHPPPPTYLSTPPPPPTFLSPKSPCKEYYKHINNGSHTGVAIHHKSTCRL